MEWGREKHSRWIFTNDVVESHLVLNHLLLSKFTRDVLQRVMRPSVRGDLMSILNHSLDQTWIGVSDIDLPFAIIVSSDEESCMETGLVQDVKKLRSVEVGPE